MALKFDFSFIDLFLQNQLSLEFYNELTKHKAMDVIYNHYSNFNLDQPILTKMELLKRNLSSLADKDQQLIVQLKETLEFVKKHVEEWKPQLIQEVKSKSPEDYSIESTIYFSIGYDMGIAFNDDVVIELSYKFYQENLEEIFYFILHELSHVVLNYYHPPSRFDQLKTRRDLLKLAKFHALLEGLGVYLPFELRMKNSDLKHIDYQDLIQSNILIEKENEFRDLLNSLDGNLDQPIMQDDWEIFWVFSQKRYWYTIGAKMALDIEHNFGREVLIECLIHGEDRFFELYSQI